MDIISSRSDGLEREWKIAVSVEELSRRLEIRLHELRTKTNLRGFRPGKVPLDHLRKLYGRNLMSKVVDRIIEENSEKILEQENLRPAVSPRIELENEEMAGGVEAVMKGESKLVYRMSLEVMPEIELKDFSKLQLVRLVTKVEKTDIETALQKFAYERRIFRPREENDATAQEGDRVRLDFSGEINGKTFSGSEGRNAIVQIPSNDGSSLYGFERKLVGKKIGKSNFSFVFPKDHPNIDLAGCNANFSIDISEISQPQEITINEDFAISSGVKNLEELRKKLLKSIMADDARVARAKLKRQLLDQLEEQYSFELPGAMVRQEVAKIRGQLPKLSSGGENDGQANIEEKQKGEDEVQQEYGPIAERRLRLALVLKEIGQRNDLQVTSPELSHAVSVQARRFPGSEERIYSYYREHPEALENIRGLIFEDKVADFLFELAKIEEREVTRDELYQDEDADLADESNDAVEG